MLHCIVWFAALTNNAGSLACGQLFKTNKHEWLGPSTRKSVNLLDMSIRATCLWEPTHWMLEINKTNTHTCHCGHKCTALINELVVCSPSHARSVVNLEAFTCMKPLFCRGNLKKWTDIQVHVPGNFVVAAYKWSGWIFFGLRFCDAFFPWVFYPFINLHSGEQISFANSIFLVSFIRKDVFTVYSIYTRADCQQVYGHLSPSLKRWDVPFVENNHKLQCRFWDVQGKNNDAVAHLPSNWEFVHWDMSALLKGGAQNVWSIISFPSMTCYVICLQQDNGVKYSGFALKKPFRKRSQPNCLSRNNVHKERGPIVGRRACAVTCTKTRDKNRPILGLEYKVLFFCGCNWQHLIVLLTNQAVIS